MRLIDADALKRKIIKFCGCVPYVKERLGGSHGVLYIDEVIDTSPTIDAVPVVRCGECANAKCIDKNESVYTCTHPQWTRRPHKDTFEESKLYHGLDGNDFCSYGEKEEGKPCG